PTNWQAVSKLKRPGMLEAASLQAVAHGSDSVMYFQIRKGRGGFEKFHGAVIDHYGKDDDRTYRECCEVGQDLLQLEECSHTDVKADVAVVYDWENRWAVEESKGPRNKGMFYKETVLKSYAAFRKQGLNVDLVDMEKPLDGYRIVAAPMLYMFRAGFEEKVRKFVELGGTFIMTYWSGVVDENDLCVLGGTPGGLMDVMGLRSTEIDALYDDESNRLCPAEGSWMTGEYTCRNLCQLVDVKTARPLMVYGEEFYQGTPALTVNQYGEGKAYYVCADVEQSFYDDLYRMLCVEAGIRGPLSCSIPEGVEVTTRESREAEYIFIQNYSSSEVKLPVSVRDEGCEVIFRSKEAAVDEGVTLQRFNTVVVKKMK
ncbi:MAG: beta-galactosidase trimerization domain-containing protein, partial [Lachnospiraceae bacterium]